MRNPDAQEVALECLKLASTVEPRRAVELAQEYYAFVTGDDAADKLQKVRDALR